MNIVEKSKEFWNRQPCNIRHSNKGISKEFFDDITKKRYYVEPHILKFIDFEKWKNKDVLELGCGIGTEAQ